MSRASLYRKFEVQANEAKLGDGAYGEVYKAVDVRSGVVVAMKKMKVAHPRPTTHHPKSHIEFNAIRESELTVSLYLRCCLDMIPLL
jgi:serine/threonine protein kinase